MYFQKWLLLLFLYLFETSTNMNTNNKVPDKGDPSDVVQIFPKYNIQLLCCRHWWLQKWEFMELSFPYWRIYHNNTLGAVIIHKEKEYRLAPNKIIMIAPNTSYSTRLYNHRIPKAGYSLIGGRVNSGISEKEFINSRHILHLFIHFNIGIPYDGIVPGVFSFELTDHLQHKLQIIKRHLNYENTQFSFHISLAIQSLITDLLTELPESNWNLITNDYRIKEGLRYIDNNINSDLSNSTLAEKARMATNAYTRLFKEELGISPQKYIKNKRIDKACIFLHHSNLSIDEIALNTGFADRYHFSRVFKQITGISPARYKKEFGIKQ